MTRMIDVDLLIAEFEKVYPLATNEMGGVVNKRIYDIINSIPVIPESPNDPSGDYISRSALREASFYHDYSPCKIDENANEIMRQARIIIDNAPAVKFSLLPADESKEESYMRGYEHGKIEGIIKGMVIAEKSQGKCKTCSHRDPEDMKCDCGGLERQGCPFPVSDDYFCKFYEKGGVNDD